MTFTTRGRSNQLHGSLFEYLQNDALDARILNFNTKAPKRFNTFGGSLGGPVSIPRLYNGKDRTFFFVDFEGNRKRTSQPEQYLVPTAAERAGNLSDVGGGTVTNLNASSMTLLNDYYPLPNINCITELTSTCSFNYEHLHKFVHVRLEHIVQPGRPGRFFQSDMQFFPQTLQELHKGSRFGFDDRFHHQLPGAIQNGNRDRFFVHVEPDILNVATHVELPPWGKVIRANVDLSPKVKCHIPVPTTNVAPAPDRGYNQRELSGG